VRSLRRHSQFGPAPNVGGFTVLGAIDQSNVNPRSRGYRRQMVDRMGTSSRRGRDADCNLARDGRLVICSGSRRLCQATVVITPVVVEERTDKRGEATNEGSTRLVSPSSMAWSEKSSVVLEYFDVSGLPPGNAELSLRIWVQSLDPRGVCTTTMRGLCSYSSTAEEPTAMGEPDPLPADCEQAAKQRELASPRPTSRAS
jgi:hypothetical protein